jgi:diguanylate cyclase
VKSAFSKAKPEPEPAPTRDAATGTSAKIPEFAAGDQRLCGKLHGEEQIRGVLSRLLIELRQESRLVSGVDAINRELGTVLDAEQLPQVMERVGGLVMQRIHGLERARQELELLLGQMVSQLDSLTRYVDGSVSDESERSSSNATLNLQITGEMQALGDSVANGTDLAVIRRQLRQRLDSISRHLQDFHERETQRARQARERTDQMRGRMDEMESEARKLKARLTDEKRLSMRDPLTQIPNRLAYEQRVGEEVERWIRFSQPTCIAVWDIDGFKAINDGYGHRAGDKVLTVVAECLAKAIRSTDFVARYGGEEFVMLLPGTTLPDAIRLANHMREAVAELGFHFRGAPVSVTISCGITSLVNGDEAEGAFDRADNAMYRAKETGRNCVVSA